MNDTESGGIALIEHERGRHAGLGYDARHDHFHFQGELAWAAVCYAAPEPVFVLNTRGDQLIFSDAWPATWSRGFDKRPVAEDGRPRRAVDMEFAERLRCLVKAGALIAAEIDRLLVAEERRRAQS